MALGKGDQVTQFTTTDTNGNVFDSATIIGKKPLVLYFYPKDNTPGCTAQACSFRDQYEDFLDLGAEVIGVSSDTLASHQKFTAQFRLPFLLLSDTDKKIRKLFGVPTALLGMLPGRVTYVIDANGIIQMVFNSMLAGQHIPKALAAVKKIVAQQK
ncbi:peroxiredoxin [Flavobacterium sp.]|uniref:peroxiredoxin n=1 Tax=Flavobacterium sp. TaxID=239 RepID=UPI0008D6C136|nr:peroxiredoxin [Flavobacterium sp.]OGS65770.1 MAG: peroxiredoxin [Flavobacteria bacterium GWA2_35_26]HCF03016.1 peroxiredoxin [Flavobacterium sp.]